MGPAQPVAAHALQPLPLLCVHRHVPSPSDQAAPAATALPTPRAHLALLGLLGRLLCLLQPRPQLHCLLLGGGGLGIGGGLRAQQWKGAERGGLRPASGGNSCPSHSAAVGAAPPHARALRLNSMPWQLHSQPSPPCHPRQSRATPAPRPAAAAAVPAPPWRPRPAPRRRPAVTVVEGRGRKGASLGPATAAAAHAPAAAAAMRAPPRALTVRSSSTCGSCTPKTPSSPPCPPRTS